jgi:hypothetical protein
MKPQIENAFYKLNKGRRTKFSLQFILDWNLARFGAWLEKAFFVSKTLHEVNFRVF